MKGFSDVDVVDYLGCKFALENPFDKVIIQPGSARGETQRRRRWKETSEKSVG